MSGRSTRCDSDDLLDDLVVLTETYLSLANGSWSAIQSDGEYRREAQIRDDKL